MNIEEYFKELDDKFNSAYSVASLARAKGFDPKDYVEIKPAPDLASRVEGLVGMNGIADLIHKNNSDDMSRTKLAFAVVKEICVNEKYNNYETVARIELAVKIGTAILTEGILVAPTEGISTVKRFKNKDGTDYIAIFYAGPIRGAGGTAAALSVALADYARRIFKIGAYKPSMDEVERSVEEAELYHVYAARLQYKPSDDDLRVIVGNCPVCIDGVPTENFEVNVHANMNRIGYDGKEVAIPNRIRGGMPLVLCEGIAQKAKKLVKETKEFDLEWDWLNKIIKVEVKKPGAKDESSFLEELVGGRPILSYPGYVGGFRLRYGRSRFTGIASKGFNPASMILTMGYIAIGGQLKIEYPGKGCVAMPVDSIEGPFVKLKSGEVLRINDAKAASELRDDVVEILSLGDMLVTYGDFRKSNTPLKPSSYVEEIWEAQLKKSDPNAKPDHNMSFEESFNMSLKNNIPLHPKYLFEFQGIDGKDLEELYSAITNSTEIDKPDLSKIEKLKLECTDSLKRPLEVMLVPHKFEDGKAIIEKDYAQSLLVSLGFVTKEGKIQTAKYQNDEKDVISTLNAVSPIKIMKRSTFIGTRVGRPEKAKERLMKPAPNVLFPVGDYGGRERNITSAYSTDSKKFRSEVSVEIARYRCQNCKRLIDTAYCHDCGMKAIVERKCPKCGRETLDMVCPTCDVTTIAFESRKINLTKVVSEAMKNVKVGKLPKVIKGIRGMTNRDKYIEPIEKGILRSARNVYIFKDGTSRFDATDVPITHFYPSEIGASIEKLKELGYDKDFYGNELKETNQLVELRHQDVILNRRGAEYLMRTSQFVDDLLTDFYKMDKYYNAFTINDMVGKLVITLSPHTSCGVLNRIIGFTDANVGFAHPYIISARRRNCDGDEDTTMLLLDALINFSKEYLPSSVGGTMDTPLILTVNVKPEEVDDEAHAMEVVNSYPLEFYEKTYAGASPSEVKIELVQNRLNTNAVFSGLGFTHESSQYSIMNSPLRSKYTQLKTMQEKVDAEFNLMDKIYAIDKRDAARKVIMSHFIPDLIGNLHSFSRQIFRCGTCNAKYRRVPLSGKCRKDGGKLLLTISKGGIEKYLNLAIGLAEKYELDDYIRQRLYLVRDDIDTIFESKEVLTTATDGQFSLLKYV